jgi:hypothetical protein
MSRMSQGGARIYCQMSQYRCDTKSDLRHNFLSSHRWGRGKKAKNDEESLWGAATSATSATLALELDWAWADANWKH